VPALQPMLSVSGLQFRLVLKRANSVALHSTCYPHVLQSLIQVSCMTISLSSIQGSEPLSKNCWVRFAVRDANTNPQENGEAKGKA
jgi:hypothetical protein